MISSAPINKVLRKYLSPLLRETGFISVSARKAWGWHERCIWVLTVRAVGAYFSSVTGWPPMSVGVWTGVYFDFIPSDSVRTPKSDSGGRLTPEEYECHRRSHLSSRIDQAQYKMQLTNPAERDRTDIWWIEPDGSNLIDVVEDISLAYLDEGRSWFADNSDLRNVFLQVTGERDCYNKFYLAKHLAQHLGLQKEYMQFESLFKAESARIGRG